MLGAGIGGQRAQGPQARVALSDDTDQVAHGDRCQHALPVIQQAGDALGASCQNGSDFHAGVPYSGMTAMALISIR